jgi:hypothetical protein
MGELQFEIEAISCCMLVAPLESRKIARVRKFASIQRGLPENTPQNPVAKYKTPRQKRVSNSPVAMKEWVYVSQSFGI